MIQAYVVYPGLGKSTLAKKKLRFADLESRLFKDAAYASYIGTDEYPCIRGTQIKEINPEWPNNYISFAKEQLIKGKILFLVPKQDNYDLMDALKIDNYVWVLPDINRIEQLRNNQIARGDSIEYINKNLKERYSIVLDLARKSGKKIIFVKYNEYLSDVLETQD